MSFRLPASSSCRRRPQGNKIYLLTYGLSGKEVVLLRSQQIYEFLLLAGSKKVLTFVLIPANRDFDASLIRRQCQSSEWLVRLWSCSTRKSFYFLGRGSIEKAAQPEYRSRENEAKEQQIRNQALKEHSPVFSGVIFNLLVIVRVVMGRTKVPFYERDNMGYFGEERVRIFGQRLAFGRQNQHENEVKCEDSEQRASHI